MDRRDFLKALGVPALAVSGAPLANASAPSRAELLPAALAPTLADDFFGSLIFDSDRGMIALPMPRKHWQWISESPTVAQFIYGREIVWTADSMTKLRGARIETTIGTMPLGEDDFFPITLMAEESITVVHDRPFRFITTPA